MDDRSRKLLSNQALPKAKLPEPRPHAKREFKLPQGVAPRAASPSLSELRAQALAPAPLADGSGTQKTGAKSMTPAAPVLGTPVPAGPAAASAQAAPSGKARRQSSQPSVPPAPPIPPPIPMSAKKKGPAAAVVPVKKAKLPKLVSFDQGHTPAPQPRQPKLIPGRATAPTPALVVASAEAPAFREATSMWFRTGDEEAARAVREAEEDAAERAAQARFAGFTRTHALLAAAGGALAVILLIAFL